MTQRNALLLAAALTAFVLVLVGGVVSRVAQPVVAGAAGATAPTGAPAETNGDATIQALLRERETARQALEQANSQLRQAAQQQAALSEANERLRQMAAGQLGDGNATPQDSGFGGMGWQPAAEGTISRAEAIAIASDYLGGGTVSGADLEGERGVLAYEVKFRDGSTVYVKATSGQVAYAKPAEGKDRDDDED